MSIRTNPLVPEICKDVAKPPSGMRSWLRRRNLRILGHQPVVYQAQRLKYMCLPFPMFMLVNVILYIFQFSIGHHQVKPGKNWRSVLLIPSNNTLISLAENFKRQNREGLPKKTIFLLQRLEHIVFLTIITFPYKQVFVYKVRCS